MGPFVCDLNGDRSFMGDRFSCSSTMVGYCWRFRCLQSFLKNIDKGKHFEIYISSKRKDYLKLQVDM